MGENRVRYKYIYYIGYLTNIEKDVYIDPKNKALKEIEAELNQN